MATGHVQFFQLKFDITYDTLDKWDYNSSTELVVPIKLLLNSVGLMHPSVIYYLSTWV